VLGTKIVSKEDKDLPEENGQENNDEVKNLVINHGQYLNSIISKSNPSKETIDDKKIKNSLNKVGKQSNVNNLKINISNSSDNDGSVSAFKNEKSSEKNISKNNTK
jgi:hypothetical protein